jgi:hypothetical protein
MPAAREIEELVLPTPPFCDAIAIIIDKLNLTKTDSVILLVFLNDFPKHI